MWSVKVAEEWIRNENTDLHRIQRPFLPAVRPWFRGILSHDFSITYLRTTAHKQILTEIHCNHHPNLSDRNVWNVSGVDSPTTKLHAQKKPCIGYRRHSIFSCSIGVISPTKKLNAQFVAVESETPLTRTVNGMIYIPSK